MLFLIPLLEEGKNKRIFHIIIIKPYLIIGYKLFDVTDILEAYTHLFVPGKIYLVFTWDI